MNMNKLRTFVYAVLAFIIIPIGVLVWAMHPVGAALCVYYTLIIMGMVVVGRVVCMLMGALVLMYADRCMR